MPADGPAEAASSAAGGGRVGGPAEEVDSLLLAEGGVGPPGAARRARLVLLALVPGAVLAVGAAAVAFHAKVPTSRANGSEGDVVELSHETPIIFGPGDDSLESLEDPCKNRKLQDQPGAWDPCKVSKLAAVKTEMARSILAEREFEKVPTSRENGSEGDVVQPSHARFVPDDDALESLEDPCKNRKLQDQPGAWDPCKVSQLAALKTEKVMNQSAHWKRHKTAMGHSGRNGTASGGSAKAASEGSVKARAEAAMSILAERALEKGSTSRENGSEGDDVQLSHARPIMPDDDDLESVEDPCKDRKLLVLLEALHDDWDPCKVSKQAAVKTKNMMNQSAHWKRHKTAIGVHNGTASEGSAKAAAEGSAEALLGATKSILAERAREKVEGGNCSGPGEDCRETRCCSERGAQCFAKSKQWAQCRQSCAPGPDPSDVDSAPWSCKEIGHRATGEAPQCVQNGENCLDGRCCNETGSTCFRKNQTFATCRHSCTPGPDYADGDWGKWTCEALGVPAPGKAPWVDEECSGDEDDCGETRCCKTSSFQCFEKGPGWAQCMAECPPADLGLDGKAWSCRELGSRTPRPRPTSVSPGPAGGKVAPWVGERCSRNGDEDCSKTQCCLAVGSQCYVKAYSAGESRSVAWAACRESCTPGPNPHDNNESWTCDTLGSRSYGLAVKGWPSLFCFIVMRVGGYELPLVRAQWDARSGIFSCDGFVVFADEVVDIADTKPLRTPDVAVGVSRDGTAGNTELFMAIWDMLFEDGRVWLHDWTIKVDPDAVLLPDRLRKHLAPHTGGSEHDSKLYVVNCNAWPSSSHFPMLYGAVEVFSNKAMAAYERHAWKCKEELPWADWGEDFFLTRCMDQIGVGRLLDFSLVGDNLCQGPGQDGAGDCDSDERAAFHPFKNFDDWMHCFDRATGRA